MFNILMFKIQFIFIYSAAVTFKFVPVPQTGNSGKEETLSRTGLMWREAPPADGELVEEEG